MTELIRKTKRIEYIDAMRGFTMILVVLLHVASYDLGLLFAENTPSIHNIMQEFRMPLFFFVSGFVLYKSEINWDMNYIQQFLCKKIKVQIISPFIFFFLCMYIYEKDIIVAIFSGAKEGYWFTFVLFEFYIFYIIFYRLINSLRIRTNIIYILIWGVIGVCFYICTLPTILYKISISHDILGLFSIMQWKYFLFFIFGTLVKKHFHSFEYLLDNSPLILFTIIIFFTFNIFSPIILGISNTIFYLATAFSGILLVFSLFRSDAKIFSQEHFLGKILQYIGKRTLDIYLIHFFFVYSNMKNVFPDFGQLQTPFPEFLYSIMIGSCVIVASLGVSHIIRLSPLLAHYLFGVKR